jgi:hypothetical protein
MRRFLPVLLVLAGLLAAAIYLAWREWTSVGGGEGMSGHGVAALVIGAIGSLVLGGGLMALVFLSSRRGYDDAADLHSRPDERQD